MPWEMKAREIRDKADPDAARREIEEMRPETPTA
jgi:hypothetical protein